MRGLECEQVLFSMKYEFRFRFMRHFEELLCFVIKAAIIDCYVIENYYCGILDCYYLYDLDVGWTVLIN